MDFQDIKYLIDRIENSSLTEFELKIDNEYIKMGKNGVSPQPQIQVQQPKPQIIEAAQVKLEQVVTEIKAPVMPAQQESAPAEAEGNFVKAPLVGTFYESPSPDKPAFKKAGDMVKKGDVLCIIEAMKVMNEIVCEYDGKVADVLVQNEQMVEYGQSLFRIV